MSCARFVQLRQGVYSATAPNGQVALLQGTLRGEPIGRLSERETAVLRELAAGPRPEADLRANLPGSTLLARLHSGGWLTVHIGLGDRRLLTIRPLGPQPEAPGKPDAPGQIDAPRRPAAPAEPVGAGWPAKPRLSRFAVLRREDDALVLESPLAPAAVTVHDAAVSRLLHQLTAGDEPEVDLPADVVDELVAELTRLRLVHDGDADSQPDLTTEQWSAHELWFHSRSRGGHHDLPVGATLWAADRHPPLPARREPYPSVPIPLPAPQPPSQPQRDAAPTLDHVMAQRQSVREHDDDHPLTLDQLGEFLHRSARVLHTAMDGRHEITRRPAPSGGALHALEIYPVVTTMTGLAAGLYHYDPFDHVLRPLPAGVAVVRRLARQAAAAAGVTGPPQVLLVVSCRFGRIMWKYQSIGYALALKDFGALAQTMYLVATAMGLAPCALGAGDSTLFATATGLDPLAESSVGEFMLGSRPISDRDHSGNAG